MDSETKDSLVPYPLNSKIRDVFEELLRPILFREDTFQRIESEVIAFETRLRVAEHATTPGAHKARHLLSTAQRLLKRAKADPGAAFVPHVLAAIDYLVKETDEIPDFANANSFRDDQAVLEAVIEHFQLKENH